MNLNFIPVVIGVQQVYKLYMACIYKLYMYLVCENKFVPDNVYAGNMCVCKFIGNN